MTHVLIPDNRRKLFSCYLSWVLTYQQWNRFKRDVRRGLELEELPVTRARAETSNSYPRLASYRAS